MTVFANNLEVSCKKQSNKVIAAFPDVCFTPPQAPPTPPGVPIPYPSFGMDSDTDKGTGTVKIGGETINLKNNSHFTKTTGTEAGSASKKGIVSSKNTGKAKSQAYSMNVKAESKNICRFSDIETNNHGSPPNAPPWPKIGQPWKPGEPDDCKDERNREAKACEGVEDPCAEGGLDKKPGELETGGGSTHLYTADYAAGGTKITQSGAPEGTFRDREGWMDRWDKAQGSACLRARRCKLEPYNSGNSCCPGQTGHHVVDAACFNQVGRGDQEGALQLSCIDSDKSYNPNKAPVICAEGPSASKGSHGALHTEMKAVVVKKTGAVGSSDVSLTEISFGSGDSATTSKHRSMSYGDFRDNAIEAIQVVFPQSQCSAACLKAQLDEYHKDELGVEDDSAVRCELTGRGDDQRSVALAYNRSRQAAVTASG